MQPTENQPVWALVAALERQTLEGWRKQYYSGCSLEEAFALHIRCLETTMSRRAAGNIQVTVSIIANKAYQSEIAVFYLQRAGNSVVLIEREGSTNGKS